MRCSIINQIDTGWISGNIIAKYISSIVDLS